MKRVRQKEAGVGKIVKRRLEQLPESWVDVFGPSADYQEREFCAWAGQRQAVLGWLLGIDALRSGFLFDFEAMRFTVD